MHRFKMRLVLWTFGLIFLQIAYSSGKFLQVTNYDEIQDHVDLSMFTQEQDEKPVTYKNKRFLKQNKFMEPHYSASDNIVERSEPSTENVPVRHKKHNKKRLSNFEYYGNELKTVKEQDQWNRDPADEKSTSFSRKQVSFSRDPADEKSAGTLDILQNDAVPLSPISQSKLESLGTQEKVNEKFQSKYGTLPASIKVQDSMQKAAKAHYEEMKRRTLCRLPIPKLVKIDEVYPNVLKTYYPSCTIIHQCSEESGCCGNKIMKCAPLSWQNVTLYFIVETKTSTGAVRQTYEGLSFMNHTECKCVTEPDRRIRGVPSSSFMQLSSMEVAPKSENLSYLKKCPLPCPSPFSPVFMADGTCVCECNNKNEERCLKYKRGEMYFKLKDNHCLFTNQCIPPSCAYGKYLTRVGRCPKQYEHRDLP